MLRITLHQDGNQCRLQLPGKLYGPRVGETETVWRSAAGSVERIKVDMREVTGVDDADTSFWPPCMKKEQDLSRRVSR
jgi:hypothetical protein